MKRPIALRTKSFPQFPWVRLIWVSAFLNVLTVLFVIFLQKKLPPELPLFYGLAEGEEQLTTSLGLTIPGVVSFLIVVTNFLIVLILKDNFLQKTLVLTAFVVSFFSLVTTIKIVFLVGSF